MEDGTEEEEEEDDRGAHCTVQLGNMVLGATHSFESIGTYLDNIISFVKATPQFTL
jgi:hypothetical protein